MTEMYIAAGIVVYVLGIAIGAWGVGRFTGENGDELYIVFPIIFWPLMVVALPLFGLIYGTVHAFGWGRRHRRIAVRREEALELEKERAAHRKTSAQQYH